jgi:type II secretion system protein G
VRLSKPNRSAVFVRTALVSAFLTFVGVCACSYDPITRGRGRASAAGQEEEFARALSNFRRDVGRFPTAAEGLSVLVNGGSLVGWRGPYLAAVPSDPWGESYIYAVGGSGQPAKITSLGSDHRVGGVGSGADIVTDVP